MGTVHKFKRPPKNEQQFRGYRPGPHTGAGSAKPGRRRLRDGQKTAMAWAVLSLLAAGIWAIGWLFGQS